MPEGIRLSENAVAVLRFEIKGWTAKDPGRRLPAYRELAEAGIMEPVPGSDTTYRFTGGLGARREEILREEEERVEQERYEPPDASNLSEPARELLLTCIAHGIPDGDESNRSAFRELVRARIMMPMGSFTKGDECVFRYTYWGHRQRYELAGMNPVEG